MDSNDDAKQRMSWFCTRAHVKLEHVAASNLNKAGIEAFCPRLKFRRRTRRGVVWFTEALFPSYLFARFNWEKSFRMVRHTHRVLEIVHFGNQWPTIPDQDVESLRSMIGEDGIRVIDSEIETGYEVEIAAGPLQGLTALVTQVLPSGKRVQVLMDFLGRQNTVSIESDLLVQKTDPRWKPL